MKFQLVIALCLLCIANATVVQYYSRSEWYPGCACGPATWQTAYTSQQACEDALCKKYYFRSEWWPGCKCGEVSWQSPYQSLGDCLSNMCTINYETEWNEFKDKFNKEYATEYERQQRFENFRANFAIISNHNQQENRTFDMEVNEFADLTEAEFLQGFTGLNAGFDDDNNDTTPPPPDANDNNEIPDSEIPEDDLEILQNIEQGIIDANGGGEINNDDNLQDPNAGGGRLLQGTTPGIVLYDYTVVDWRTKNAVTAVKNQGGCGSCWIFSAVGAIEGLWSITNVGLHRFSEQHMLDCVQQGGGCSGGWMRYVFNYTRSNGINTENEYAGGLYVATKKNCTINPFYQRFYIRGWTYVSKWQPIGLMMAVRRQPVSIAMKVNSQFSFYANKPNSMNIFDLWWTCLGSPNHAMVVVGYGYQLKLVRRFFFFWRVYRIPYWIIKNSWGSGWGQGGYARVKITWGAGVCGINNYGVYPYV